MEVQLSESKFARAESVELAYVYLRPPSLAVETSRLIKIAEAVPPDVFTRPQRQQQLIHDMEQVQHQLDLAERMPTGAARQAHLRNALRELERTMEKYDGCSREGTWDRNDVIESCYEQQSLMNVSTDVMAKIGAELEPEPPEEP